jgi:basic membrane lipoprotein Med (substrate-binding protein (PBP1-ABC) superfamily)
MRKVIKFLTVFFVAFAVFSSCYSSDVYAASKKSKKGGLKPEEITQLTDDITFLTKKVYAQSLFSPAENEKLINVKIMLDTAMLTSPSPEYAPLYYRVAGLYKSREYKSEAIECYQTILENFADTALAPKAQAELVKMGVKIALPTADGATTP